MTKENRLPLGIKMVDGNEKIQKICETQNVGRDLHYTPGPRYIFLNYFTITFFLLEAQNFFMFEFGTPKLNFFKKNKIIMTNDNLFFCFFSFQPAS